MQDMERIIHEQKTLDDPPFVDKFQYYILNQQRSKRLLKTYAPSAEFLQVLRNASPQRWLIITEFWCGDSAQNIPPLHLMASASEGRIQLRLLFRDTHTELMDVFATEGARSIPKLVVLNEQLQVINTWGPRPAEAQALVKSLRADPATRDFYADHLHLWYAGDKCKSLENEIEMLLTSVSQ